LCSYRASHAKKQMRRLSDYAQSRTRAQREMPRQWKLEGFVMESIYEMVVLFQKSVQPTKDS